MGSHDLGLWLLASSIVVAAISVFQLSLAIQNAAKYNDAVFILRAANSATVIILGFCTVLIPRRPEVIFKNRKVDGQWTVSALSRYTWGWVRPVLDRATKTGDLEAEDVPYPDNTVRADRLQEEWETFGFKGSLLRSLIWAYKGRIATQWSITTFRCFLSAMPYWIMLRLIRILETRGRGSASTMELWTLVLCLALFTLIDQVILD